MPREARKDWTREEQVRAMKVVTPRVRTAVRLYATGAVATKKEAAEVAGVSPITFGLYTNHNPVVRAMMERIDAQLADESIQLSTVIANLSRRAVKVVTSLMEDSPSDAIRLKAAQDLLDRNPETSKTQKHEISGIVFTPSDAKELAAALVAGARVKEQYKYLRDVGYEGVTSERVIELPASVESLREE